MVFLVLMVVLTHKGLGSTLYNVFVFVELFFGFGRVNFGRVNFGIGLDGF